MRKLGISLWFNFIPRMQFQMTSDLYKEHLNSSVQGEMERFLANVSRMKNENQFGSQGGQVFSFLVQVFSFLVQVFSVLYLAVITWKSPSQILQPFYVERSLIKNVLPEATPISRKPRLLRSQKHFFGSIVLILKFLLSIQSLQYFPKKCEQTSSFHLIFSHWLHCYHYMFG